MFVLYAFEHSTCHYVQTFLESSSQPGEGRELLLGQKWSVPPKDHSLFPTNKIGDFLSIEDLRYRTPWSRREQVTIGFRRRRVEIHEPFGWNPLVDLEPIEISASSSNGGGNSVGGVHWSWSSLQHNQATLIKIFVDWYTPTIRWSMKNQLIRLINLCINPFFSKKPLTVFHPLQTDIPWGIFFIDKPFFRSWNRYTLNWPLIICREEPHFCGYICFNYGKRVLSMKKIPQGISVCNGWNTVKGFFTEKKGLYRGWSGGATDFSLINGLSGYINLRKFLSVYPSPHWVTHLSIYIKKNVCLLFRHSVPVIASVTKFSMDLPGIRRKVQMGWRDHLGRTGGGGLGEISSVWVKYNFLSFVIASVTKLLARVF